MLLSNCDRCYKRKSRCDKLKPACTQCARAGTNCVYTDRSKERRFAPDHVEHLERRLRQVEARNHELADELRRARSASERCVDDVSPASHRGVDAVSEVTYLSINAAGERQPYIGSSSGLLFADLVRSSVNLPSTSSRGISPPTAVNGRPAATVSPHQPTRKDSDLPAESLAHKLYAAYIDHDAIIYPFLEPHFLLEGLNRLYSDHDYYSHAPSFEVFVFHMVLAIATTHCFKHDWQMLPGAEMHHARAMQELNAVMATGGMESLQAMLLLCQYRTGSSVKDNSASMWHLVGICSRLCLELGLHREATYTIRPSAELSQSDLMSYRKQELGRRAFWSVMALDRITSSILGRPLAVRDDDVDTLLPSEEYDDLVIEPLSRAISGISRVAIFNHVTRYRLFCGKLLTTLHRKRSPGTTVADAMRVRQALADELEQWRSDLERLNLWETDTSAAREQSCYLTKVWYEVLYANASLMIWRPSPLLIDTPRDQQMLRKVFESASHAVSTYSALHKSRQINYSWVTLQSVFMAGLSYIYAVSRHMRERRLSSSAQDCCLECDPSTIEVVNITRACSNVLVAVAERWSTLRHCHEVFDRLSDAVLADAIKLQTSPSQHTVSASTTGLAQANASHNHMDSTLASTLHRPPQQWSTYDPTSMAFAQPLQSSPLAVDNEFLHCFGDLQHLYDQQQLEDPVMHLSQDWLAYLNDSSGPPNFSSQLVESMNAMAQG